VIYFYNKIWLFLLPLSVLPIILHLLFVKKVKKVEFTYLFLIQKVLKQYLPKKRIVDIIVVLLRCLIIFFIIIFLCYPVMYSLPKKNIINLYILIDNSCSMQQKIFNYTKFELCKEYIVKLLNQLTDVSNLKVKIILFNDSVEVVTPQFVAVNKKLVEQIVQLKPSFRNTNLSGAIEYVLSECIEKQNEKNNLYKILVFTDLAEHIVQNNVSVATTSVAGFSNNIDISFCYPKIEQKNCYFNNVNVSYENELVEIKYVAETSPVNKEELVAELVVSNQKIDTKKIYTFDQTTSFKFFNETYKNLFGYILLNINDVLSVDNKFYFSYEKNIQEKKVLCIINEPAYLKGFNSKKFYFENLSLPEVNLEIKSFEQEKMLLPKNYDVYISVDLPNLDLFEGISDKTIIIFPGETADTDNYSTFLDGIEFIELKDEKQKLKFSLGEDEEFSKFIEKFEYGNINVNKRYLITVTDTAKWKVLLSYTDGTPAVLNKNNFYIFSFSLDRNWTNFVYKPIFVGLLKYIIVKDEKIGQKLKEYYFVGEQINSQNIVSVKQIGQNDLDEKEEYKIVEHNKIIFFVPGLYEISNDSGKQIVAVNIHLDESKTAIVSKNMVKKMFSQFKNLNIEFFEIKEMKIKQILQWILGKDISADIVYLMIIMFILETVLSRLGKRMV
jgi:hypothetical protein